MKTTKNKPTNYSTEGLVYYSSSDLQRFTSSAGVDNLSSAKYSLSQSKEGMSIISKSDNKSSFEQGTYRFVGGKFYKMVD